MKMTTDEAVEHLFHPKLAKALKEHVQKANAKPAKKG